MSHLAKKFGNGRAFGKTHDQTCIPPSFASLLQMMCMFVSVNFMMHFFCSFSMAWITPESYKPQLTFLKDNRISY